MANRIKEVLSSIIDNTQVAFVGGRRIRDNILMCQELFCNYYKRLEKGNNYTMKIDLIKSYDSMRWSFILEVLNLIGFPDIMIRWIEAYISSLKYSVYLNGELVGLFGGSKGLRQRDSLALYLFFLGN